MIKHYPIIAAPLPAALCVYFFLGLVTAMAFGDPAVGMVVQLIGGLLILTVGPGVTVVMARDALAVREPSMRDAFKSVMMQWADVFIASILVMVSVGLGLYFMLLPGMVAGVFLVFTLPAVLLDGHGAISALTRSAALARDNLGAAIGLVGSLVVAGIAVMPVYLILGLAPILGLLAVPALAGAVLAYLIVVAVRVYQTLPRR